MRILPALAGAAALVAVPAHATDTWTNVRPGIDYLYRELGPPKPQRIHAVRVDLSDPRIGIHASADLRGQEWAVNTLAFARNTDAIVAINGDWAYIEGTGDAYLRPASLAISEGNLWSPHWPYANTVESWGYVACTLDKQCTLSFAPTLDNPGMVFHPLQNPTVWPLRYYNAVGANAVPALVHGQRVDGCYDGQTNAPRSSACTEIDGTHLWLVVVDGRNAAGGESGMSCDEVRDQLLTLGCHEAMFLDGGGSSTLVVDDQVKNTPSDGGLRTVANHFGITWDEVADPRCRKANGRWCDGTVIAACAGGRYKGDGDCGYFGAGCQEDGDFAFCVHPSCPDGNGLRHNACLDATRVAGCNDGQYSEGDCGAFGLVCGGDRGSAQCMDRRCAGPNAARCDGATLVACTDGIATLTDCAAQGLECRASAAACVTPGTPEDTATSTGTSLDAGDAGTGDDAFDGTPAGFTDRGCACDAAGGVPLLPALLAALGALDRRRRSADAAR
ncbi:MAG: hypothetical protein RLZZ299_474 [Pseudomonadota bacterium]|jgi:uncharacterized protein (TIGR03382 family)